MREAVNSGRTMRVVTCPQCGLRKARRACPALSQQICAVCCGTKRLVEIACPADCAYLATAREHPPAAVVRRQQDDLGAVVPFMQDLDRRQSSLFFLVLTFLARRPSSDLPPLIDDDVVDALNALATTYETAARGLIYEQRPPSLPADRLMNELKPLLADAGQGGGSAFERDAAVVLRRVETAARQSRPDSPTGRRDFLDLLGRIIRKQDDRQTPDPAQASRVILP